jgi:phosphoribosyl-ATP pyrophosphohydrolase
MNEKNNNSDVLGRLFETIKSRQGDSPDKSYTAKLFSKGRGKIACKLVEEATETIVAALYEGDDKVISESADLLFHLLVLWADAGVEPAHVWEELARREGTSGIDEKEARQQK